MEKEMENQMETGDYIAMAQKLPISLCSSFEAPWTKILQGIYDHHTGK